MLGSSDVEISLPVVICTDMFHYAVVFTHDKPKICR